MACALTGGRRPLLVSTGSVTRPNWLPASPSAVWLRPGRVTVDRDRELAGHIWPFALSSECAGSDTWQVVVVAVLRRCRRGRSRLCRLARRHSLRGTGQATCPSGRDAQTGRNPRFARDSARSDGRTLPNSNADCRHDCAGISGRRGYATQEGRPMSCWERFHRSAALRAGRSPAVAVNVTGIESVRTRRPPLGPCHALQSCECVGDRSCSSPISVRGVTLGRTALGQVTAVGTLLTCTVLTVCAGSATASRSSVRRRLGGDQCADLG